MRRISISEIESIYLQRLDEFCSVVAALTGDRDGAQDIVHEAFASALRSRASYRANGSLSAWIWRIVVNAARDHKRRCRTRALEVHVGCELGDPDVPREDAAGLACAIQALPERQRLVVFLRYYADLDYRQIGAVLGVATGTVSATLHAAHRALECQLDEVPR